MTLPDTMKGLVCREDGYSGRSEGPTIENLSDCIDPRSLCVPDELNTITPGGAHDKWQAIVAVELCILCTINIFCQV